MSYEVDGKGNIRVFTFTLVYLDDDGENGSTRRCFTDYTQGWDWARREGMEYESLDDENRYGVEIDSDWVEHTDEALRAYYASHEGEENEAISLMMEGVY